MSAAASPLARRRRRTWQPTVRQLKILAVLAAGASVPPVLGRLGVLSELWALVFGFGVSYALMAISLNLLMGYAGQISLGHAGLLGVGAYVSGILTARYVVPNLVALLVAGTLGAVVALVIGLPALRLRGLYLAITTIAFVVMMEGSVLQIPALSRGSAGVTLPRPEAWSFVFTSNADFLAYLLLFLVVFWVLDENVLRSKLGRAFRGIRDDEQVAQAFGVDVGSYKLLAFVLSGALAGVAGALYGHLLLSANSAVFDLGFSLLLLVFVVVGGLGNRTGVVVAALAFGILPAIFREVIEVEALRRFLEGWEFILGSALLVYTLATHPSGLGEAFRERREEREAARLRRGEVDDDEKDLEGVPALPRLAAPAAIGAGPGLRAGDAMLEVEDVTVRFGGITAVDRASLWVPAGAIVGLIGPNGAGKTTLFNAISGFQRIDGGRIGFLGYDIGRFPPHVRARLGLARTFQRGGLAQNLSVRDNLLLAQHQLAAYEPAAALAQSRAAIEVERGLASRADEVMAALGFQGRADTPVRNLSGGQRRIVEMACALVTSPELMLLDEPSAGMAPAVVENLAQRLRDLRDELGRTVLLVEHHVPLVLDVCDHVYVLDHGQVIASGRPDDVVEDPRVLDAYLGRRHNLELEEVQA
ncbi:MAG: ABC transporter permease subunit [Nitriliruptorales bacterium]